MYRITLSLLVGMTLLVGRHAFGQAQSNTTNAKELRNSPIAMPYVPSLGLRVFIYKDNNDSTGRYLYYRLPLLDIASFKTALERHDLKAKDDETAKIDFRIITDSPEVTTLIAEAAQAEKSEISASKLRVQPVNNFVIEAEIDDKIFEVGRYQFEGGAAQTSEGSVRGRITATIRELKAFAERPRLICRQYGDAYSARRLTISGKIATYLKSDQYTSLVGTEEVKDEVSWKKLDGQVGVVLNLPLVGGIGGAQQQSGTIGRNAKRWVSRELLVHSFQKYARSAEMNIWDEFGLGSEQGVSFATKMFENWLSDLPALKVTLYADDKERKVRIHDQFKKELASVPSDFKGIKSTSGADVEKNAKVVVKGKGDIGGERNDTTKSKTSDEFGASVEGGGFALDTNLILMDCASTTDTSDHAFRYYLVSAMSSCDQTTCSATWPLKIQESFSVSSSAEITLRPAKPLRDIIQIPIYKDYPHRAAIKDVLVSPRPGFVGMSVKTDGDTDYYRLTAQGDDDLGSQALVSVEAKATYDPEKNAIQYLAQMWVCEWNGESGTAPNDDWSGGYATGKAIVVLPPSQRGQKIIDAEIRKHTFQSTFLVTNTDKVNTNRSKALYKDGGFTNVVHDPNSVVKKMTGVIDRSWGNLGHDCQIQLDLDADVRLRYESDSKR